MQAKPHYLVDGYNLLFQTAFLSEKKSLEEARYALISELDSHATLHHLFLTIVFDAGFQTEELRRGHFGFLEIIFTSRGQSADAYLVERVNHKSTKEELVVVTSDKKLARQLTAPKVSIIGVRDFLQKIRKKSRKKTLLPQKKAIVKALPQKKEAAKNEVDMKNLPPLSDLDAWEAIFKAALS